MVSLVLGVFNAWWNFRTTRIADQHRVLDQRKSAFVAQVVVPVEGVLTKFDILLTELRLLGRKHAGKGEDDVRSNDYSNLQTVTFEPAMTELQLTIKRVSAMNEPCLNVNWYEFEDRLDHVRDNFDTLCRPRADLDRLNAALTSVEDAVTTTCNAIRSEMTAVTATLSSRQAVRRAEAAPRARTNHGT